MVKESLPSKKPIGNRSRAPTHSQRKRTDDCFRRTEPPRHPQTFQPDLFLAVVRARAAPPRLKRCGRWVQTNVHPVATVVFPLTGAGGISERFLPDIQISDRPCRDA